MIKMKPSHGANDIHIKEWGGWTNPSDTNNQIYRFYPSHVLPMTLPAPVLEITRHTIHGEALRRWRRQTAAAHDRKRHRARRDASRLIIFLSLITNNRAGSGALTVNLPREKLNMIPHFVTTRQYKFTFPGMLLQVPGVPRLRWCVIIVQCIMYSCH